jgi:hypothetical protein
MSTRRSFSSRVETFGLDTTRPWALDALRLLFHSSRAYEPLVLAWDLRHPGTRRALDRLVKLGFVDYQPGVVVDTFSGELVAAASRRVPRYRTTAKGSRLAAAVAEDMRVFTDTFSRTAPGNVAAVIALVAAFDLKDSHRKFGLSTRHVTALTGLPLRTVKWWIKRLKADGYLRELDSKIADVREVIPPHWRVTRQLCRQLEDVIDAFDTAPDSLKVEFRLSRTRFLADVDPARVAVSGATDFDHDVECQRILGALLGSPLCVTDGIFVIEPKFNLDLDTGTRPWTFQSGADAQLFYQPDAELRERTDGVVVRSILEYERYQTRRDAWNHIERFLGYLALSALPFEPAVLRFVVDSESREKGYIELIEAFCDYAIDHPERLPRNPVVLSVTSTPRLLASPDPLAPRAWFRIALPAVGRSDTAPRPVLHPAEASPYDEYFSRAR